MPHPPKKIDPRRTVLIAEDSPLNQELLVYLIEGMGFRTITADNGKDALELFEKTAVDLVLLDLHMPIMDGLETASRIKKIGEARGFIPPILAVTGLADTIDAAAASASGIRAWVDKPFDRAELSSLVKGLISGPKQILIANAS